MLSISLIFALQTSLYGSVRVHQGVLTVGIMGFFVCVCFFFFFLLLWSLSVYISNHIESQF